MYHMLYLMIMDVNVFLTILRKGCHIFLLELGRDDDPY